MLSPQQHSAPLPEALIRDSRRGVLRDAPEIGCGISRMHLGNDGGIPSMPLATDLASLSPDALSSKNISDGIGGRSDEATLTTGL